MHAPAPAPVDPPAVEPSTSKMQDPPSQPLQSSDGPAEKDTIGHKTHVEAPEPRPESARTYSHAGAKVFESSWHFAQQGLDGGVSDRGAQDIWPEMISTVSASIKSSVCIFQNDLLL